LTRALTSNKLYLLTRRPEEALFYENEKAFKIIREEKGFHFDPGIIEVFFDNQKKVIETKARYCDDEI